MVCGQARNALFDRIRVLDRRPAAGYSVEKNSFAKTGKEWKVWNKSAPTPKQSPRLRPKRRPRPSKLCRDGRNAGRNGRARAETAARVVFPAASAASFQMPGARSTATAARAHPHVADRGVRTADRGGDGHGRPLNPVYWIGTGLLVFWCVGQLFAAAGRRGTPSPRVVMYFSSPS